MSNHNKSYGDESHLCSEGYTPYGWQFPEEDVFIPVEKGYKLNVWGLITRTNQLHWMTTEQPINARFVFNQLEELSMQLQKPTVVVLDNASIHKQYHSASTVLLAKKRLIHFLSASLFSSPKPGRNPLA